VEGTIFFIGDFEMVVEKDTIILLIDKQVQVLQKKMLKSLHQSYISIFKCEKPFECGSIDLAHLS
jgi:hypothetical protein